MTPDDIRRAITNQKSEHAPHAFKAGQVGMNEFDLLYPVLRRLPVRELSKWMRLIDEMRATHNGCGPCYSKILAYSIFFTEDLLPERNDEYYSIYKTVAGIPPRGRDFIREVWDSINGNTDTPFAEVHKRWWREQACEMPRPRHLLNLPK
jgi:hypothetical protein